MTLYYAGNGLVCKLKVYKNANLAACDALMARDGMKRCTRSEYLRAKAVLDQPAHAEIAVT